MKISSDVIEIIGTVIVVIFTGIVIIGITIIPFLVAVYLASLVWHMAK